MLAPTTAMALLTGLDRKQEERDLAKDPAVPLRAGACRGEPRLRISPRRAELRHDDAVAAADGEQAAHTQHAPGLLSMHRLTVFGNTCALWRSLADGMPRTTACCWTSVSVRFDHTIVLPLPQALVSRAGSLNSGCVTCGRTVPKLPRKSS